MNHWLLILSPLINAISFTLLSVALVMFLRNRNIGHRMILRMALVFLIMRATGLYFAAARHYKASPPSEHVLWFNLITSLVGFAAVALFLYRIGDVLQTFQESEHLDHVRDDGRSDREQARQNIRYVSKQQLDASIKMLPTKLPKQIFS